MATAVSTFLVPEAIRSITARSDPLSGADRALVARASSGERLPGLTFERAVELAATHLRSVFPDAPVYDRTFPADGAGFSAARRGIWFDLRAAHRALGLSTFQSVSGRRLLPGWASFLILGLQCVRATHELNPVSPATEFAGELRRFGWFTFHASGATHTVTEHLVEVATERSRVEPMWLSANRDLVDALTARLIRGVWQEENGANEALSALRNGALQGGVYPYGQYVDRVLSGDIGVPHESPARRILANYEAGGYLFHGSKERYPAVDLRVPAGEPAGVIGRPLVHGASISASPSSALSALYALGRHRGVTPGFCTHPHSDGQVGVSIGMLPETKLAALDVDNQGFVYVLRPDQARPRPDFIGEFFYEQPRLRPVDVVVVTPTDYLDYLLDAPTKATRPHLFHDISAPCSLGGMFSFQCPPPGPGRWPLTDERYRYELGQGWLTREGDPLNVPNRPHSHHTFRTQGAFPGKVYRPGPGR